MQHLIRLSNCTKSSVNEIFRIADELRDGKYSDFLQGKTVVMFFPESSIRTRVTFERGIYLLGGQTILFPPDSLDKKEELKDVVGYLNNWIDGAVVRYKNISVIEEMAKYAEFPIVNAMTDINHPCEMLADMYALSKMREDFTRDDFLFVGAKGNIGMAWKEAAELMEFSLTQSCPPEYAMDGVKNIPELQKAIIGKDIICTDSLSTEKLRDFSCHQVTLDIMKRANKNAVLNPCPPFYRGEEVSEDAIDSEYFAGYSFKKYLLEIQQAILIYCFLKSDA